MKFSATCSYVDVKGETQDCSSNAIEESRDVPYKFPIEFVTSERRVTKSFTMGNLYFMLDNFG